MNTKIRITLVAMAVSGIFLSTAQAQNRPGNGQFRIQPVRTQPAQVQPARLNPPAQIPYRPRYLPGSAQQANGRNGLPLPVEGADRYKAGGFENPGWVDLRRSLGVDRPALTPRATPAATPVNWPAQDPAYTQPLNTPQQTNTRWVPTTAAHANASCDSQVLQANGWVIKERRANNSCYWELSAEERAKLLPQNSPSSATAPLGSPVGTPVTQPVTVVRGSLLRRTAPTRGTIVNAPGQNP